MVLQKKERKKEIACDGFSKERKKEIACEGSSKRNSR
jgi:hypothetical protein